MTSLLWNSKKERKENEGFLDISITGIINGYITFLLCLDKFYLPFILEGKLGLGRSVIPAIPRTQVMAGTRAITGFICYIIQIEKINLSEG